MGVDLSALREFAMERESAAPRSSGCIDKVEGRLVGGAGVVLVELGITTLMSETTPTVIGAEGELLFGGVSGVAMKLEGTALRLKSASRFLGTMDGR